MFSCSDFVLTESEYSSASVTSRDNLEKEGQSEQLAPRHHASCGYAKQDPSLAKPGTGELLGSNLPTPMFRLQASPHPIFKEASASLTPRLKQSRLPANPDHRTAGALQTGRLSTSVQQASELKPRETQSSCFPCARS